MLKSLLIFCLISTHVIFGNIANAGVSIGYSEDHTPSTNFRELKIHGIMDLNISQLIGYRYVIEKDLSDSFVDTDLSDYAKIHMVRFHLPLFNFFDMYAAIGVEDSEWETLDMWNVVDFLKQPRVKHIGAYWGSRIVKHHLYVQQFRTEDWKDLGIYYGASLSI